jgi:2,4'-dihydroxyacetophenone dioxygenase
MSAVHIPGITAPPSTACVKLFGWLQGPIEFYDENGGFIESLEHDEPYCRDHGIPINKQLYI